MSQGTYTEAVRLLRGVATSYSTADVHDEVGMQRERDLEDVTLRAVRALLLDTDYSTIVQAVAEAEAEDWLRVTTLERTFDSLQVEGGAE